jgi:hypothetical protein
VSQYYYLAAQLPHLSYGQNVPMSSQAFKTLAAEHLSSGDLAELEHCTLEVSFPSKDDDPDARQSEGRTEFVTKWKEWERTLRQNLAKVRAKKLKREGVPADVHDYPFDAAAAARTASAIESPLEAEIFLDKARWDTIEGLQGFDIFSENAIYAYMLKLLLMERRMAFNTEEGFTEYKGLYAAILGDQK